ncbi:MAG: prepilin-type N-terminal cleavage/methylation domain-containing protein [Enterococcus sp.]|nr:prepilin-type N-terminal cleavage/methylation domain-containing protein [Enterococcus sp.]
MKFQPANKESGVTMIEILVVLAILAVLVAIAVPSYLAQRKSSYEVSLKADLSTVAYAMEDDKSFTGKYPTVTPTTLKSVLNVDIKPESMIQIFPATAANGNKPCVEGYHKGNPSEYWHVSLKDRKVLTGHCG